MKDLQILDLMLPAAAECMVLVGIHSYLGLHVIRRRVIFVDLAFAQVAALGTALGFVLGMAPDSVAAWIFSVLTATLGATLFTVTRLRHGRIPQEAFIGLIYAVAAAVIILVTDLAPQQGADSIGKVLTGAILYVQWESIGFAAIVYALIGILHYVFRHRFLLISTDPEEALRRGWNIRSWDFLFYLSFGVVISISVRTAGVLLVFVFLVAPAIFATMITDRIGRQLAIGWAMGTVVTVLGLVMSYALDVPSGPAVVSLYGVVLAIGLSVVYVFRAERRARALGGVGIGTLAIAATAMLLAVLGDLMLGTPLAGEPGHAHGHAPEAVAEAPESAEPATVTPEVLAERLASATPDEQAAMLAEAKANPALLLAAAQATDDASLRLVIAETLVQVDRAAGGRVLVDVVRDGIMPFVRSQAHSDLQRLAGRAFAFDPEGSAEDNAEGLVEMEAWLAEQGGDPLETD